MRHLIDKDKIVAEIERRIRRFREEKDSVSIVKNNVYKGILSFLDTLEVKEVDLEDEIDKNNYWNQFEGGTKLNIDSTTEIKFDETTKFSQKEFIKMEEDEFITSDFYKRIFKNTPTVTMKIFSRWNRNKRKENES